MKYFIPPVLALLFMGWPTVSSLLSSDAGSTGEAGSKLTPKEVKEAAEAALQAAQDACENLDALAEATATPYGSGPLPANPAPPPPWQEYVNLSEEVRGVLEAMHGFPDPATSAIDTKEEAEIKAHLAKVKPVADAAKTAKVKQVAQDYVARLETARQKAVDRAANEKLLQEARALFAAKKCDECVKKLGDWKGDLAPEAQGLRDRAEFHVRADPLAARVAIVHTSKNPRDWADAVRELTPLVDAGSPAAATAEETGVFERLQRAKESFEVRGKIHGLLPRPLGQWAQNAKQLLATVADAYARQYCRTRLREVLDAEVPMTKRTSDESHQEAFTVPDESRLLGTFQVQGAGWFKYWPRGMNVQNANESQIFLSKNITAPGLPLTVRIVQRYAEARKQLASRLNDRHAWEEFRATCEQLQKELSQRYTVAVDVTFVNELAFIQEVLESWEDLQEFLGP